MRMYDIIQKKKEYKELTKEEIEFFVKGYSEESIPDYQASALAMAIYFAGMTDRECAELTMAMAKSGKTIDFGEIYDQTVDKHSTGGVGDKTTLIIAPIVASLGCKVGKMTGRGLGHTGGTIDKLESIPGYRVEMSPAEFFSQVAETGICVIGQSEEMVVADKKLYALRDVTATVDSIPLIASSIMSKKIASGSKTIVLDVKVGSGTFMKTVEEAQKLAEKMVMIGKACGRNMKALVTNMNRPLGHAVGNSLEVIEAIGVLTGKIKGDIRNVSVNLAAQIVSLNKGIPYEESKSLVEDSIASGKAFNKMKEWIRNQGGDVSYLEDVSKFPKARIEYPIKAEKEGYIEAMDTQKIGISASLLGAGRKYKGDTIDFSAGISVIFKTGDYVRKGQTIAIAYTQTPEKAEEASQKYIEAIKISDHNPPEEQEIIAIL